MLEQGTELNLVVGQGFIQHGLAKAFVLDVERGLSVNPERRCKAMRAERLTQVNDDILQREVHHRHKTRASYLRQLLVFSELGIFQGLPSQRS